MERAGSLVRLREATLDDAEVVDARARDPALIGEFNDFGLGKPTPLAENLAHGQRMVGPDRGTLLVVRIDDDVVIGDIGWHTVSYGPTAGSRALNIGISLTRGTRSRLRDRGTAAARGAALRRFEIERVKASTDVDNVAEQRSLEKAGFTREGVIRRAQFRAGPTTISSAFHRPLGCHSIRRGPGFRLSGRGYVCPRLRFRHASIGPRGPCIRDIRHSAWGGARTTLSRSPAPLAGQPRRWGGVPSRESSLSTTTLTWPDQETDSLRRFGYDVDECGGPSRNMCPVLAGRSCDLAEAADVLVYEVWASGDAEGSRVLIDNIRDIHRDTPRCPDVTRARADFGGGDRSAPCHSVARSADGRASP